MDDFVSLSNRLLSRCPAVGIQLSQQLINDSWRTFQSRREWSFRRRSGTFAPPPLYTTGLISTNVATGIGTVSATGTAVTWVSGTLFSIIWTGTITINGVAYTIATTNSPTSITLTAPVTGGPLTGIAYSFNAGNPNLITGIGTNWTPQMVGQQIRPVGLLYPYYTIQNYLSPTSILIDQPWAGPDVTSVPYQILQCYFPVPEDFGYWYVVISLNAAYRLWLTTTQSDLAVYDPQRSNMGTPISVVFRDYTQNFGGTIGPVIPVAATGSAPISTTTFGFSYVSSATYIIQIATGGAVGTAAFQWMRSGQTAFTGPIITVTDGSPMDLQDGIQAIFPTNGAYTSGDLFVINAQSQITTGVPRYEIWPSPSFNTSKTSGLLPYVYVAKEYDLTVAQPQLPPFVANRGEVLLEMALEKCARYPGPDIDHPNPYFNLALALQHQQKAEGFLNDMERNDEEVGVGNITYQEMDLAISPWETGSFQQRHAPYMIS